jgi:amino acid transporter
MFSRKLDAVGMESSAESIREFVDMGSGWPKGWVSDMDIRIFDDLCNELTTQAFFMGLIQGAYCLSPTGMLASMSEEVKKPEQTIPRAM